MYLTVLKMDRNSLLGVTKPLNINSNYAIHKWLTYQQNQSRKDDHILYRIIERDDNIFLYIQTDSIFNLEGVEEKGLTVVRVLDLEDMLKHIGDTVFFDLQTFPYDMKLGSHRRYFITDYEGRITWLKEQFARYNVVLLDQTEYKLSTLIIDKDKNTRVPTSCFKGKIKIEDPEKFKELITHGFGRIKNFGLGLVLFRN